MVDKIIEHADSGSIGKMHTSVTGLEKIDESEYAVYHNAEIFVKWVTDSLDFQSMHENHPVRPSIFRLAQSLRSLSRAYVLTEFQADFSDPRQSAIMRAVAEKLSQYCEDTDHIVETRGCLADLNICNNPLVYEAYTQVPEIILTILKILDGGIKTETEVFSRDVMTPTGKLQRFKLTVSIGDNPGEEIFLGNWLTNLRSVAHNPNKRLELPRLLDTLVQAS